MLLLLFFWRLRDINLTNHQSLCDQFCACLKSLSDWNWLKWRKFSTAKHNIDVAESVTDQLHVINVELIKTGLYDVTERRLVGGYVIVLM